VAENAEAFRPIVPLEPFHETIPRLERPAHTMFISAAVPMVNSEKLEARLFTASAFSAIAPDDLAAQLPRISD